MERRDIKNLTNIGIVIMGFIDPTAFSLVPNMELIQSRREHFLEGFKQVREWCEQMHLHGSAAIAECLIAEYEHDRPRNVSDLRESVLYFQGKLYNEIDRHIFVQLDPDRAEILKSSNESLKTPAEGSVAKSFSSAANDLGAATMCYVTHMHTACVFHCMRVAEKGLRALATELNVPFKIPFEYENWQNIIEMAEKAIRNLEQTLPKGSAKSETLKFYSEAATQFFYFKNAWRNHVSHARDSYDGVQAKAVLEHVNQFMQYLVDGGLHD